MNIVDSDVLELRRAERATAAEQLRRAEAREERRLCELAEAHHTIGELVQALKTAHAAQMLPRSAVSLRIADAIRLVEPEWGRNV